MRMYPLAAIGRAMRVQEVILRAMSGEITWIGAAEILGISARSLRRWKRRYETYGYDGLLDRRRGRPSPKRAPFGQVERILRLYRESYTGFNVRHFHQIAQRDHGIGLSYTFVKKALQGAGLVRKGRTRRLHRQFREPKACCGQMVHLDGSPHRWLDLDPDARQVLIAAVDDATKGLLYAQLWPAETTLAVMTALKEVVQRFGIPMSLYTDRASWAFLTEQVGGNVDKEHLTQVGRALWKLGIEHIAAYSPQARGRMERANRTLQDRLVNELRLKGISTVAAANRYLRQVFIPEYNERFGRPPADPHNVFVAPDGADLDQIFCHEESRVVGNDDTVRMNGVRMQLGTRAGRQSWAGLKVMVRRHLDETHSVWYGMQRIGRFDGKGKTRVPTSDGRAGTPLRATPSAPFPPTPRPRTSPPSNRTFHVLSKADTLTCS
jgi:transposase